MSDHSRDLELVRSVLAGSVDAWHSLIDAYGGLILSVVRRHVYGSEDDVRTVFVEVLDSLYHRSLARYEGRAALSTWLVIVVRGHALDYLRRKLGRPSIPAAIGSMGDREVRLFQLHHVEGLSLDAVRHRLNSEGISTSFEDLLVAFQAVEDALDSQVRRRLSYGREAAREGAPGAGRTLEFADDQRLREEEQQEEASPEFALEGRARSAWRERVLQSLEGLPPEEREVLRMKFEDEMTAAQISVELGLGGARRVYTLLDRALARLRRWNSRPDS